MANDNDGNGVRSKWHRGYEWRKRKRKRKKKKARAGTPAGYKAGLGGQKIRSRGKGRGLMRGKGRGPMGKPFYSDRDKTRGLY